jgi:hypothetical protein
LIKENLLDEDELRDIRETVANLNDEYKSIAFDTSSEEESENDVDDDY